MWRDGSWVQLYSANRSDAQYVADIVTWTKAAKAALHAKGLLMTPNWSSYGRAAPPAADGQPAPSAVDYPEAWNTTEALLLTNLSDGILGEAGFSALADRCGSGERGSKTWPADIADCPWTEESWANNLLWVQNLQRHGKAFFPISYWGTDPRNVSLAARKWMVASFLLAKGDAAAICIDCAGHRRGGESYESKAWPEYSAAVSAKLGRPLGPAATTAQQGVWRREFSGGLVLVNARGSADEPKGKVAVVKLAQGLHYTDPQGAKVTGSITLRPHGAAILLKDSAAQAAAGGLGLQPQRSCSPSFEASVRLISPMVHILPTSAGAALASAPRNLTLAAGERTSFQLLISPESRDDPYSATVRVRTSDASAVVVDPLRQVEFVRVSKPTNSSRLPYGAGLYPDPLPPLDDCVQSESSVQQCTIKRRAASAGGQFTPLVLWVEVQALSSASAAHAEISIDVELANGITCQVPLAVRVYTFATRRPGTLLSGGAIEAAYLRPSPSSLPASEGARVAKLAYKDAADHGVNTDSFGAFFPGIGLALDTNGTTPSVQLNTTAFDAMRAWAQEQLGWRRWSLPMTGPLFGGKVDRHTMKWHFHSSPPIVKQIFLNKTGALEFSPQFLSCFTAVYVPVAAHLRMKGWMTNVSVLWHDEPDWADAETLAIWLKMANLWKSTIPELNLYQTFCTPAPDRVLRMIDQACVHVAVYRGGKGSGSVS